MLHRYAGAAEKFSADVVVRLTGDCPLADPAIIDDMILLRKDRNYDYVTNVKPPTWPDGLDVSVLKRSVLVEADAEAELTSDREHVVPWMWRHTVLEGGDRFSAENVAAPEDLSSHRWTIDESKDYLFLKALVRELGEDRIVNASWWDILDVIVRNPNLGRINMQINRDAGYLKSIQDDEVQ